MGRASEQEYNHLISHVERLIRLTTIILSLIVTVVVGAGSIFFYKSVEDMKGDEKNAVASVKASAQNDIAQAKDDVLNAVRTEARKRVDEEFDTNHVTEMVENTARRKVGKAIDRQIQDEVGQTVNQLQDQIRQTTEVANLANEIRIMGSRAAFDELTRRYRKSEDATMGQTERMILESVIADYEKVWVTNLKRDKTTAQQQLAFDRRRDPKEPIPTTTAQFVKLIRNEDELNQLTIEFLALDDSAGQHFTMFDTEGVEKWCAANPAKCQ